MKTSAFALAALLATAGCTTLRARADPAEQVEVFTKGAPTRPYSSVAELNFYQEKRGGGPDSLDDVLPELRRRARAAGADAVIGVTLRTRGSGEAVIYRVTATAIAYERPAKEPGQQSGSASPAASPPTPAGHAPAERPAQPEREVDVIVAGAPGRPVREVARLDFYVEKRSAGGGTLDDVLPELKRQARMSGAEAVSDVKWTLSDAGEGSAGVYHVTATCLAYGGATAKPSR
jgi:uncharacterized protein YbjQ (UPF0145 family)